MRDEFCGWYFKCQTGSQTLALIPAFHVHDGTEAGSVQLISDSTTWNVSLPAAECRMSRRRPLARLGRSVFSPSGIHLDLRDSQCHAWGEVRFGPPSPIRYDIMGPFAWVPFLECRHRIFSMRHRVTGRLVVNDTEFRFSDALGYIEGDRGCSFPRHYAWSQCFFSQGSLMLSVAEIPLGPIRFTGAIAVIRLGQTEYRLATYLGARAEIGHRRIALQQGGLVLTAALLEHPAHVLQAPAAGAMTRQIRENAACHARYRLTLDGRPLLDLESHLASFEYEYPF